MKYALSAIPGVMVAVCSPALADGRLDPTTASSGVDAEVSYLDREITLATNQPVLDVDADGAVAGLQAHIQTGSFFRGEVRALSGDLDYDTNVGEISEGSRSSKPGGPSAYRCPAADSIPAPG